MKKKILGFGNAVLDMISNSSDEYLLKNNLEKGSMSLVEQDASDRLVSEIKLIKKSSGGSVANTLVAISLLGIPTLFCGKVKNDDLGNDFKKNMEKSGTKFLCNQSESGLPTARCLVFVTPDGERTMQTFLGASTTLDEGDVSESFFEEVSFLLIEGYLWSSESARKAIFKAIKISKKNKIKIIFSLSNHNLVKMFKDDFLKLIIDYVDILIGNEMEFFEIFSCKEEKIISNKVSDTPEICLMTKSKNGVTIFKDKKTFNIDAIKVDDVVDTTGAGDMFAAGFISKLSYGENVIDSARFGCKVAAKIIKQYGARPSEDLFKDLI